MLPQRQFQEGYGKQPSLRPFCGHTTELLRDRLKGGAVFSFSLYPLTDLQNLKIATLSETFLCESQGR